MATQAAADLNSKNIVAADGCAVFYDGKLETTDQAAVCATADVVRFMRVPAGTRVSSLSFNTTTSFGTTAPCTIRLAAVDGVSDAIIDATGSIETTATLVAAGSTVLQTAGRAEAAFHPVTTKVDCFLECLMGTVASGAKGVASAVLGGMAEGAR